MNRTQAKWIGSAIALFAFMLAPAAHAQYPGYVSTNSDTGFPSYGAYVSSGIDTVNLMSGGLSLRIPILSRKGRGVDYELHLSYESKTWVMNTSVLNYPPGTYTTSYNWYHNSPGWVVGDNIASSVSYVEQTYTLDPGCPTQGSQGPQLFVRSNWVYNSPDGSMHMLPLRKNYPYVGPAYCSQNQFVENYVAHTDDGHVKVDITNDGLTDHTGINITRANGSQGGAWASFVLKDTNGNSCCGSSSGWVTDTLGRPLYKYRTISSTEYAYDYYDSSGTVRSIIVDTTTLTLNPSFPTTSYSQYRIVYQPQGAQISVISKITLPNGLAYTFSYIDPATGQQNLFGEVMKITLPTGGYVRYKWTTIAQYDPGPADPSPTGSGYVVNVDSRRVSDRYVSEDGTSGSEKHWAYDYTNSLGVVVTDPLGNKEIHLTLQTSGTTCAVSGTTNLNPPPVDYGVEYMDPSGKILKKVSYDYACDSGPVTSAQPGQNASPSLDYTPGPRNNRLIRTTTTLMDTNQVTKSETDFGDCYTYSSFSSNFTDCRQGPTQSREYAFGSGTPGSLVRYTTYSYLHNSNSTYLNAHIWDRVSQTSVYDASNNLFASTSMSYDTTSITGTSSVPQHDYTNYSTSNAVRGNPTVISRWLNTTNSWLATTNYYNDVGNLVQTTDPGGHTYTLSYTDNFTDGTNRNSQGYLTSVTGPTTNSVSHIEGKQYLWYTGLTAAVCGQNAPSPASCTNSYTPSSSSPVSDYAKYTYDSMGRPYTVTHGDGGTTSFTFTEPSSPSPSSRISVSSTSAIDSFTNLTNAVVIDGLGRVIQTQLTSDPDGTDYVDTVYDDVGRVSTGSNPHRGSSATTDGVSTNNYDGFSRTVKVIPPDGSSSSNNIQTYYQGATVTAVDQTGRARRSTTDSLGRLIEVDEPAAGHALPGLAASYATGTVTITGSVQVYSYQQDDGPVCDLYDDGGNCIHWHEQYETIYVYDSGTFSITVNGHTNTVSYGQGDTPSSIASNLASAINADSSAFVTASASGAVITFTAKTSGAGYFYSLSSSTTYNTTYFNHASFYSSFPYPTLMGGSDAVPAFPPGESTATPYVTLYFYDIGNNLTCVEQHGNSTGQTGCSSAASNDATSAWRIRRFAYNSLGQLLTSKNPESGTITYTYDSDGNVLTKVAPAPNQTGSSIVTTTLTYDALHRVLSKAFSDSTPSVTIAYDGTTISGCSPTLTAAYPTGRRTAMCDAAGWEAWSYDSRGHVATERRNTNGVTKSTSYAYNFQGGVISITYPSGRTVSYTYNAAGQTTSASDVSNGITYASNAHYAAPGHLSSLQESGSNLIYTMYYNNRLQPCRISVKSSGTAPTSCSDATNIGNILDFTYSFTTSSANNGNVASITNNINTARSQSFTYDELNRISTAQTQATSGTYAWGLSFVYDPWANLLQANTTQGNPPNLCVNVAVSNRLTTTCTGGTSFGFDAAGNMTSDGSNSRTFNAEGELTAAAGVTYTYDGDGSRVKKSSGKLYWYGMGSDPLSESDASGNLTAEYIFMSGTRIAMLTLPAGTVNYYVQDHLGSSRVVTNSSGTILDDSDFYPYGGERAYSSSSGNNYKFTGNERDTESGLDDFAARFYASNYGRFISADDSKYMHPAEHTATYAGMPYNSRDMEMDGGGVTSVTSGTEVDALSYHDTPNGGGNNNWPLPQSNIAPGLLCLSCFQATNNQPPPAADPNQLRGAVKNASVTILTDWNGVDDAGLLIQLLFTVKDTEYEHFNFVQFVTTNSPTENNPANQPYLDITKGAKPPLFQEPMEQASREADAKKRGGSTFIFWDSGKMGRGLHSRFFRMASLCTHGDMVLPTGGRR
jgi:RHS repeat-associated protein